MKLDLTGKRPALDLDDAETRLTDAQKAAMSFDREVAVTAGAGAGKTHTLSLRYTALLLDIAAREVLTNRRQPRPDIESVLVLTFTEKAAEEMADRCYKRLLALSGAVREARAELDARAFPGMGLALSAAIDHLVDTVDLARISTFHGFCTRVLREYPSETHTPPGFVVLDQHEATVLQSAAVSRALREAIDTRPEDMSRLLDSFGRRDTLVKAVRSALDKRGELRDRLESYATESVTLDDLLQTATVTPDEARSWLRTEALDVFERLEALLAPVAAGRWANDGRPLLDELRSLPEDALQIYVLYQRVFDVVVDVKTPKLRSLTNHHFMGSAAKWPDKNMAKAVKPDLESVANDMSHWVGMALDAGGLPGPADPVMLDTLGAFARLVQSTVAHLDTLLDERRAVDFSALQLRAVRAVCDNDALRDRLAQQHRYLMVDEFQDTDELQWSLVNALGRGAAPHDRIFLVGDVKQAIYGFRGGDVTVFRTATDELGVTPVVLPDNFRSRDVLIEWFNAFFRTVLGAPSPKRPAWEAPYEPLNAGRKEPGGSVTLVTHELKKPTEAALVEAEATARLIASEILPGAGAYEGLQLSDRQAHPTPPVAILLKARTHLRLFEDALRRNGVPYVVSGGVGFWQQPEVLDLVNALVGLSTGDPLHIVGVLRSPLLAVPDTAVVDLCRGRFGTGGEPLDSVRRFGIDPLPDAAPDELHMAWVAWRRLLALRDRLPVAMLVREILSAGTAWHAYQLERPDGQAEANALRLVERAGSLDAQGLGLDGVAAAFRATVEAENNDSQAVVTPGAARVVLMTVHGSKGLEFPVVLVPRMAKRPNPSDHALIIRRARGQWDLACRVIDPAGEVRKRVKPGRYVQLDNARKTEEQAESLRLLYVAATRARDHLVLLGSDVDRSSNKTFTWMHAIAEHHGQPAMPRDGLTVRAAGEVLELAVPATEAVATAVLPSADAERELAPIDVVADFEVSPSSLDLYHRCPAWWYLRHVVRIPDVATSAAELQRTLAGVRGTVIHSVLEDDQAHDDTLAKQRWSVLARAAGASEGEVRAGYKALRDQLTRAAGDDALRRRLDADGMSEVSFRLPRGHLVLKGQIDRLYRDPDDNAWVVLDYKSERVHGSPLTAALHHERQLTAYAWAATQVLQTYTGDAVKRGEVYFTDTGYPFQLPNVSPAAFAEFEALLDEVEALLQKPWSEVEEAVVGGDEARPCDRCPFYERGCRGKGA